MDPKHGTARPLMPHRRTVVVKIGSNSLVDQDGRLDQDFLHSIAEQLQQIVHAGWNPIVISSGAVACGAACVEAMIDQESSLSDRQALATIGQADLMHKWQQALAPHDLFAAQLLVTGENFQHRESYLNVRSTLHSLFDIQAIPIINENDPVSIHGVELGDNDRLSALVASMLDAERLIIATDTHGLYDRDPRHHSDAQLIAELPRISQELVDQTGGAGSRGTGGMRTKIEAAAMASQAGVQVHIVWSREPQVLPRLLAGESIGTVVLADPSAASSRRHWLAHARVSEGTLSIDDGAVHALMEDGSSLLAVGIVEVSGHFARGDTVAVATRDGQVIASGLVAYNDQDLRRIQGKRRSEAIDILQRALPKAVIQRDNLLIAPVLEEKGD